MNEDVSDFQRDWQFHNLLSDCTFDFYYKSKLQKENTIQSPKKSSAVIEIDLDCE